MKTTTKQAGTAAIVWGAATAVLGFSTGQPPDLDAPGREIASYLADARPAYLVGAAVFAATLPLLFIFTGELRRRVSATGDGLSASVIPPAVSTLVTGTALAYAALLPFVFGDGLGSDATDGMLRYAYVLTFVLSMLGNVGGAVLVAAAGAAQSAGARTASWVVAAVVGVTAVGGLVSPAVAMIGGMGVLVVAVWSVVVGVGMVREPVGVARSEFATA